MEIYLPETLFFDFADNFHANTPRNVINIKPQIIAEIPQMHFKEMSKKTFNFKF